MKTNMLRALFRLRLEELLALVFFIPTTIFTFKYAGEEGFTRGNLERFFALLALFLLFITLIKRNRYLQVLRDLLPIVCCIVIYLNLHDLIHFVSPVDRDAWLLAADAYLFGTQPSLYLEKWIQPWLTDISIVCYSLFYFIPTVANLMLYFRHDYRSFRHFVVSGLMCFYLGYFGYILVPAVGPRVTLLPYYQVDLASSGYIELFRQTLDNLQNFRRDCFPSLHNGVTLLTLMFSFVHLRRYFYFLLPIALILMFATIYLRYHYVVDQLAGWALAIFCYYLGPKVSDFWDAQMQQTTEQAALNTPVNAAPK